MFVATHKTVEHAISIPLSVDETFPLFTPEGERLWIAEWKPRYLYPPNGETLVGMVFTTGEGAEETFWTVADFDTAAHQARYIRVTPGSRSVIVEVRCQAAGPEKCEVEVTYTLTGLSEAGNAAIDAFVGEPYVAMIEEWRDMILRYLERLPHRVSGA